MDEFVGFITNILLDMYTGLEKMLNLCGHMLMGGGILKSLLDDSTLLTGIANTIKPVAYTIVSICFVIEFIKITAEANILKWEYGVKVFAKLVLARVCIDIAPLALDTIYTTFVSWVGGTTSTLCGDMSPLYTELSTDLNGLSFFGLIGWILSTGAMYVVFFILVILCLLISLARVFELSIYFAISPIPCALMPLSDGTGSRITKKFFLSFSASCLSGLLMVICIRIYCLIVVNIFNNGALNTIMEYLTGVFGVVGYETLCLIILFVAMTKCNSWAKAIMDV